MLPDISASSAPKSRLCNKAEVAEFFEIHVATLDAWIRRGCPYVERGGRGVSWVFDLLEVARWRFLGVEEAQAEDPEQMSPKERLDWYRGNRERDAHAKDQDQLIPFDLAEQLIGAQFAAVRAALLSQHNTIASKYPEIPTDAIGDILSANRDVLESLAQTRLPESIGGVLGRLAVEPSASAGPDGEPVG